MTSNRIDEQAKFDRFCFDLIYRNIKRGSAALVAERVRWELITEFGNTRFPKYSTKEQRVFVRAFQEKYPEHRNFFKLRGETSISPGQTDLPFDNS